MSIYRYPESKIIDEITFRKSERGAVRAYIHVRPETGGQVIGNILHTLNGADLECIPFTLDGKPTLEVRGFKREKQLLHRLADWTDNQPPAVVQEKDDKINWWDSLKKRTLQLSGLAYIVGDYGFASYGYKEADKLVMAGAFSYFLGTLSLIFYGRNDQSDLQVKDLAKNIDQFLTQENIRLSPGSALHEITRNGDKDVLQSLNEFCKRYPSEIFNSVTALAGVFVATSAYKNKIHFKPRPGMDAHAIREMRTEGWMDFGLGTLTTASGTLATLVKEKKPDPDDPPAHGVNKIWQKIREHPLAIAGVGYTISTLFHAGSTWKAYKEAKRVKDFKRLESVPKRALFVGMALLSEFLLAVSSKGHGEGVVSDNSVDKSVIALAADLIAGQPKERQAQLVENLGNFLSKSDVLAMSNKEVKEALHAQAEAMRRNPWTRGNGKLNGNGKTGDHDKPADEPEKRQEAANWQAKALESPPVTPLAR